MEHFRKILAGLDLGARGEGLTPGSRRALQRALWIAKRVKASVWLLHSAKTEEYWDSELEGFVDGVGQLEERRRILESLVSEVSDDGVETHMALRSETAWFAIIQEVLRESIDVVVAAKRTDGQSMEGRKRDNRKLGTVAQKLLRECPCAVWLEDLRQQNDPSLILAATDLTPVGDRVIELSASVADELGASLHIVNAFSLSLEAQLEGGEARREFERQKRATARKQIEQRLASTPMAGAAEIHIGLTSPTQAILECMERLDPGLVVMGTVSRGGIAGLLTGNTAERLIDRIDCALLTIKPENFVCPVSAESPE